MGIDPTSPAWKAGALPLCYARVTRRQATTRAAPASRLQTASRIEKISDIHRFTQQRSGKLLRIERLQIVELFTEADEFDR